MYCCLAILFTVTDEFSSKVVPSFSKWMPIFQTVSNFSNKFPIFKVVNPF